MCEILHVRWWRIVLFIDTFHAFLPQLVLQILEELRFFRPEIWCVWHHLLSRSNYFVCKSEVDEILHASWWRIELSIGTFHACLPLLVLVILQLLRFSFKSGGIFWGWKVSSQRKDKLVKWSETYQLIPQNMAFPMVWQHRIDAKTEDSIKYVAVLVGEPFLTVRQ